MSIHNRTSNLLSLGKFGDLLFIRQAPMQAAKTHRGMLASLSSQLSAWRNRRAALRELARLSDRELADIGVTRQQIPHIVSAKR